MQKTKYKYTPLDFKTFVEESPVIELALDPIESSRLYELSESINWLALQKEILPILGARSGPIVRLVCGAIFLKSFYELSSDELLAKWPYCPEFRHFCGGAVVEDASAFPIPLHVLDILEGKLNGEGNDAMIRALLATPSKCEVAFDSKTFH